jgi:indole-3-glycerol phosphate synthase
MITRETSRGGSDLLRAVVAASHRRVADRRARVPLERLAANPTGETPRGALFRTRLARAGGVNVIAECKRRSPSRGVLVPRYDAAALARQYESGGAAAISVLTEPAFFDGSLDHLTAVRSAVSLPVLRKDFIVDPYQLFEAREAGADAVLLIAAALSPTDLARLIGIAEGLGLAALVEVHDERELIVALDVGASLLGVNSRNLRSLDVDPGICEALAPRIPKGVLAVAESGLNSAASVRRIVGAGYAAVLIGEWLVTHHDPAAALRSLCGATQDPRPPEPRP